MVSFRHEHRFWPALAAVLMLVLAGAARAADGPPPPGWPANLRWDLVPRWIQWSNGQATIDWPPREGCAGTAEPRTVPAGSVIDRYGSDLGKFFSPKGESFRDRAMPYVCSHMDYSAYRVRQPFIVEYCDAAPWFGEPGGAIQFESQQSAADLVKNKFMDRVRYDPAGSKEAARHCRSP